LLWFNHILNLWLFGPGRRYSVLAKTVSRSDGVLEYWSDGLSFVNSMHRRICIASVLSHRRSILDFRFSNTPLLSPIRRPTLHKYVEQSKVMESHLPGGKQIPGSPGLIVYARYSFPKSGCFKAEPLNPWPRPGISRCGNISLIS
jgi:hypothetical protein